MTRVRTLLSILVSGMTGAASICLAQSCGGEIIVGYDDAGNYHTGDGAVWTRGAMCTGFDASHYLDDGGTACAPSLGASECTPWFVPASIPAYELCKAGVGVTDDAGNPLLNDAGMQVLDYDSGYCFGEFILIYDGSADTFGFWYPQCGSASTEAAATFCSAFFDQFISHGSVVASCVSGICHPYAASGELCDSADPFSMVVQTDDGGTACKAPCQP